MNFLASGTTAAGIIKTGLLLHLSGGSELKQFGKLTHPAVISKRPVRPAVSKDNKNTAETKHNQTKTEKMNDYLAQFRLVFRCLKKIANNRISPELPAK